MPDPDNQQARSPATARPDTEPAQPVSAPEPSSLTPEATATLDHKVSRIQQHAQDPLAASRLAGAPPGMDLPPQWEKWLIGAYLRGCGWSQAAAAKAVRCGERTLRAWEKDPRWPQMRLHAAEIWMMDVVELARLQVAKAIAGGDTDLAVRMLESAGNMQKSAPQQEAQQGAPSTVVQVGVQLPPQDRGELGEARVLELKPPRHAAGGED